jgi:LysM repeat protein
LALVAASLGFLGTGCAWYDQMVDQQDLRLGTAAPPPRAYAAAPAPAPVNHSQQEVTQLRQEVANLRVQMGTLQDNQRKLMGQIGELQDGLATRDRQVEELRGLVSVLESRVKTSDADWQQRMAKLRESMETQQKKSLDAMAHKMAEKVAEAVQKAPASSGRVHVVQKGDVLSVIAAVYGVTVKDIKAANGLKNDQIFVGQKLKIPGSSR